VFSVTIRDHMMVAHILQGPCSGLASACTARRTSWMPSDRKLSTPTAPSLDIGRAAQELHVVVSALSHRNLVDDPERAV
jgi:hypothetical protein